MENTSVQRVEIGLGMLLCAVVAFIPYPPILGEWEANTVLYTFAPEKIWLNTIIHPRANTGGYEYFPMDLARYAAAVFGYTTFSLRLMPILYGFLSLWTFYSILRTWCATRATLLATLLLATNAVFLVFQHQLVITIFDIFCILLCVKTYLLARDGNRKHVMMFAGAFSLTALMYHSGRYVALAIAGFWIAEFWWMKIRGKKGDRASLLAPIKVFGVTLIALLFVLNPFNLIRFFSPKFLVPEEGGAANNEFALSAGDLVQNLTTNLVLIANSFVGNHSFFGDFPSEIILGTPFPLTNWAGLSLAIIGIGVLAKSRNVFIVMLIGVVIFVPALSQTWPHYWTSLSIFRQSFSIIPLFLVIGLGIDFMGSLRGLKWIVYVACLGLVGFQTYQHVAEIGRFTADIEKASCGFEQGTTDGRKFQCSHQGERYLAEKEAGREQFEERGSYFSPYANVYSVFEKTMLPHKRYSKLLAEKIRAAVAIAGGSPVLVHAPMDDFVTSRSSHLYTFNYHQFFLALYLQEEGMPINYIVPYARSLSWTESLAGFLLTRLGTSQSSGGLRTSRHLNYPYPIKDGAYDMDEVGMWEKLAGKLSTKIPEKFVRFLIPEPVPFGQFRQTQGSSDIYLITSEIEREYFLERFSSYTEVQL